MITVLHHAQAVQGSTMEKPLGYSKAKAGKSKRRATKPRRKAPDQALGLLQGTHLEQPAATIALAAHMGYDMEYGHPSIATYSSHNGVGAPASSLRSSLLLHPDLHTNCSEQPLTSPTGLGQLNSQRSLATANDGTSKHGRAVVQSMAPGEPSSGYPSKQDLRRNPERSGANTSMHRPSSAVLEPAEVIRLSGAHCAENTQRNDFTFSACRSTTLNARSVANLPEYGAKRRKQSRESLQHDDLPFQGFTSWLEVSFFTLKVRQTPVSTWSTYDNCNCKPRDHHGGDLIAGSVIEHTCRTCIVTEVLYQVATAGVSQFSITSTSLFQDVINKVPQVPGVYEWGALPPGTHTHNDILAFYLGKAGSYAGKGSQNLATRFARYA